METDLARITVVTPRRRVDVALPEHVPLAELLPELLEHAGADLADAGESHGGWVLRRADGVALATGLGLRPQGVRDGDVLHLVAAHDEWPEWEYDDVAEAVAEGARRRGGVWTPADTRTATLAAAAVPLALGLSALLMSDSGGGPAGLGAAALLTLAAATAFRAYGERRTGVVLAGYALPCAFAGGAKLVTSGDPVGVLPILPWLGAAELLAGSAAVLLVGTLAGLAVPSGVRVAPTDVTAGGRDAASGARAPTGATSGARIAAAGMADDGRDAAAGMTTGARVAAAGVMAGLLAALAALTTQVTSAVGAAAALISVLVCGIGLLPPLAVRLGRAPLPPIGLPDPAGDAPAWGVDPHSPGPGRDAGHASRVAVLTAVGRTDELLTGMLIGHAVLAVGAFAVLATAGTFSARLLLGAAAVALLLRARLFVTVRQRVPLIGAGLAGFAAFGAVLLGETRPGDRLLPALIAMVLLIALVTVAAGVTYAERRPSPYWGRATDLLEAAAVIAVIPVACAVAGLYTEVSGLT